jgi:hypothetical protein
MPAFLQALLSDKTLVLYLGLFSLVFFFVTLLVIPWLILQIPADYFHEPERHSLLGSLNHPVLRIVILLLKNILGILFILLGIMLLVLPGQGLLAILLGLLMIDFPGKYSMQRWFVSQPSVLHSVNWLRNKGKKEPIKL